MTEGAVLPQTEGRLTEWLLRCFALLLMGFFVYRWGYVWWFDPSRWSVLLLLVSEGYTLMLILLAHRASHRDLSVTAVIATVYAVSYVGLLDPKGTVQLAPEWAGAGLQLLSMGWQFTAKIMLGRSFGLLPALRGLVLAGPYSLIRHPIYFGYLVGHIGFLLVNFSWSNAAVLALLYAAQVVRIKREESMLADSDANYRDYQQRVRWRLLPFVF